ncbi:hypothetical protein ACIGGE_08590 [Qipengyuania sp. NPDC077410]|uniref:hypothetical protein n=1 Tax=Qipengyuania sp. NPDC077410 TaxID=3364496 RepID=UPI0037C4F799
MKEQLRVANRSFTMRDYDEPATPADTPPVIDPKAKAKDDTEGQNLLSDEDDEKVEQSLSAAQDGGEQGVGEAALDKS